MMKAYKKTALRLHSLADEDREWMLDQLQDHQRQQLMPLLDELSALGIPRRQEMAEDIGDLVNDRPEPEPEAPPAEAPQFVRPLLDAAPEELHGVLCSEASETVAALLLAHAWPWRQPVLGMFDPSDQDSISDAMDRMDGKLSPYVSRALVGAVIRQIEAPLPLPILEEDLSPDSAEPVRRWSVFRRWPWRR